MTTTRTCPRVIHRFADLFQQLMSLDKELTLIEQKEKRLLDEIQGLAKEVQTIQDEYDYQYWTATVGGALAVGNVVETVDESHAVVTTDGNPRRFCMGVLDAVDRELLKPGANVLLSMSSLAVVGVLPADSGWAVPLVTGSERPDVTYADVAGLDEQKQKVLEAIELPLTHSARSTSPAPALRHHAACSYTARRARARPCRPEPSRTTPRRPSSASTAPSSCTGTWARAPGWCARYSRPPGTTRRPSCSSVSLNLARKFETSEHGWAAPARCVRLALSSKISDLNRAGHITIEILQGIRQVVRV